LSGCVFRSFLKLIETSASVFIAGTVNKVNRSRKGYSLTEMAVVLFLLSVASAIVVVSFTGGEAAGEARITQASLDTAIDAAINASLSNEGTAGVTISRLQAEIPEIVFVNETAAVEPSQVSVNVNPNTSAIAVAAITDSGFCFYTRLLLLPSPGEQSRKFGVVKQDTSTPCTGQFAEGLLSAPSAVGSSWQNPTVFG